FYETAARRAVYAALRIDEVILQRCRAVEIFRQIGTAFEPRRELAGGEIGSQHSRFSHKISGVWELGIWDWLRNCHGVYPDGDPCFLISDFDQIGRAERVGYALLLAIDRFCVREAQVIKLQQLGGISRVVRHSQRELRREQDRERIDEESVPEVHVV